MMGYISKKEYVARIKVFGWVGPELKRYNRHKLCSILCALYNKVSVEELTAINQAKYNDSQFRALTIALEYGVDMSRFNDPEVLIGSKMYWVMCILREGFDATPFLTHTEYTEEEISEFYKMILELVVWDDDAWFSIPHLRRYHVLLTQYLGMGGKRLSQRYRLRGSIDKK